VANQTKLENDEALQAAGIARTAMTIPLFCAAHSISEGLYQKMRANGFGPREVRIGRRVLITSESAAKWRREREAADDSGAARRKIPA
jgi:hypothetical protein